MQPAIPTIPANRASRLGLVLLGLAAIIAAAWLIQHHHGIPLGQTIAMPAAQITGDKGGSFVFRLPRQASQTHRRLEYRGTVLENGSSLGPGAENVASARRGGMGTHIVSDTGSVYFSASDGTDPRTNGRVYAVRVPMNLPRWILAIPGVLAAIGLAGWLSPLPGGGHPAGIPRLRDLGGRWFGQGRWKHGVFWLALFLMSWWHYSRNNDFLFHYHPDEPKKAFFITHSRVHFNHPQLLTTTVRLVHWLGGGESTPQQATQLGRDVSAAFAAAASTLLAWAAVATVGYLGMVLLPMLWFHPGLHEAAHYMKEDTALVFGLAATAAAGVHHARHPGRLSAIMLGAGAGLAASGKYIGLSAVPIAMLVAVAAAWRDHGAYGLLRSTGRVLSAAMVVFLVINFDAIRQMDAWHSDLGREFSTFGSNQKIGAMAVPNLWFIGELWNRHGPWLWTSVLAGVWCLSRHRGITVAAWLFPVVFSVAYLCVLCCSTYPYFRYALPVEVFATWFAACGLALLANRRIAGITATGRAGRLAGAALALVAALGITVPWFIKSLHFNACLNNDTRHALYVFARDTLPPDAVIAQTTEIRLPFKNNYLPDGMEALPQIIHTRATLADFGDLVAMRALGITHLAVFPAELPGMWPDQRGSNDQINNLPALGKVVWRSHGPYGGVVARELALIQIDGNR